jgi:uncharacterized protein YlxW (UPF0749 family)
VTADSQRIWRFAGPVALAACGVLLVTSARAAEGGDLRGSGLNEMPDLVRAEERRAAELSEEVEALRAEVDDLTAQGVGTAPADPAAPELPEQAGIMPVEGPGISITLDDAPEPSDTTGLDLEAYIVHQQDLEAVINALWAGGAEALMLMDQRIVTTSSVTCVGSLLHLHSSLYPPPYTVTAIGNTETMLTSLDAAPGVQAYLSDAEVVGLGYELATLDQIVMPGYDGPLGVSAGTAS